MPSGPKVATTSGRSSPSTIATRSTSSSNGTSAQAAVGIAEPLVPVRRPADDAPGVGVLDPADGAEGLPGGAAPLRDRPALAVGGVHQEEPELGIGQVQRDDRGDPVRVVVRVRHHHAQRPAHGPR